MALAAFLGGCAGTDFVRPDPSSLTIGKTSYQEVVQRFGQPFREGTALKNEKSVRSLSYAYAVKGKTTRAQVIAMLGRPGGAYVHPMVKAVSGDAIVYVYIEASLEFQVGNLTSL